MAFIDIFNFKKYFSKPSDAQVARYGHVNALYDNLLNSLTIESAQYTMPAPITPGKQIEVTTKAGIINIEKTLAPGEYYQFKINNVDITENTVLLVNGYDIIIGDSLLHVAPFIAGSPDGARTVVVTNISPVNTVDNFNILYYIVG